MNIVKTARLKHKVTIAQ